MKTSGLHLLDEGVFIVWDWVWEDEDEGNIDHVSESTAADPEEQNTHPYLSSESDYEPEMTPPVMTHTVTFKCIGTTHDANAQEVLAKASKLIQRGEEIPVMIEPEPDNQFDSKAIAFKCRVEGRWQRIGYIVREALDEVHTALTQKKIIDVSFSWIKFLVVWMRSGPGYYAGINITINGEWPLHVLQCASTR